MDFSSIYLSLKRSLDSDPEYFSFFCNEPSESPIYNYFESDDENLDESGTIKRAKFDSSVVIKESVKKIIFYLEDKEFSAIQKRSFLLLEELFTLTLNWPTGKLQKLLSNHDSTFHAIKYNFNYRSSIFDAPLVNIPDEMKNPLTKLPRIIVHLMKSLARPESLKTIGAFRIEVSATRCDQYQDFMEREIMKSNINTPEWLDSIPVIAKMTLLKRYFRKIPGSLVDRIITELLFELYVAYEFSQCLSEVISLVLNCLPLENFKALAMICLLLNMYGKHERDTMMSDENLAIIWAPSIFDMPENDKKTTQVIIKIMNLFITRWEKFFICKL